MRKVVRGFVGSNDLTERGRLRSCDLGASSVIGGYGFHGIWSKYHTSTFSSRPMACNHQFSEQLPGKETSPLAKKHYAGTDGQDVMAERIHE